MDRRIASMGELNRNMAELKTAGDNHALSPTPSTKSAASAATDPGSRTIPRKSVPDLRTPSRTNSSEYSNPAPGPTLYQAPQLQPIPHNYMQPPSTIPEGEALLAPPLPPFAPVPQAYGQESPTNSRPNSSTGRPASSGSLFHRPGSRDASRSRDNSRPGSRAQSPAPALALQTDSKLRKRRSWLPGLSAEEIESPKETMKPTNATNAQAWLLMGRDKVPYDMSPLLGFQKVHELWDENGDTLVYLHNNPSGPGPSFRIDSECFASSQKLVRAAHGATRTEPISRSVSREFQLPMLSFAEREQAVNSGDALPPPQGQSYASNGAGLGGNFGEAPVKKDIHLCLPQPLKTTPGTQPIHPNSDDAELLVTVRNLFAFLQGIPLLATARCPSLFSIFMRTADILERYNFRNFDNSTLGEEPSSRFTQYLRDFNIADVRTSREQTIEAMLLGERMKCFELYNEGYVHAVGKYPDIAAYKTAKTAQISELSRKRLERSHLFLDTRLRTVRARLQDFDFPALWAGFANSTSSSESKLIRFKQWRIAFQSMRKHVLDFYKHKYGHWPPKAKSKKNNFEESGLNRVLLKDVYRDMCDLYDVLADRSNLTTRHVEIPTNDDDDPDETVQRALRRILSEYDRSTPPVQPPIPFDTPWIPTLASTRRGFDQLDPAKRKKEGSKKLPDSEINTILMQSYNRDLMKSTPFLEAFFAFERRSASKKSIDDIADIRVGQWIFMYVVIQALPLVVIDAPGIRYTEGVEYFLSEFSKEAAPWLPQDRRQKTVWRIPGSDTVVDMPAASVEHSLDAIYHRSHCWQVAQQWAGPAAVVSQVQSTIPEEELLPPIMPSVGHSRNRSGSRSPDKRASGSSFAERRISMGVGLEQLPLPSGVGVSPSGSRPTSSYDPSKSFNSILGLQDEKGGKKKK